jgi:hypothetical protein
MSTDTIRDLILNGYAISIHCRAYPCTSRVTAASMQSLAMSCKPGG